MKPFPQRAPRGWRRRPTLGSASLALPSLALLLFASAWAPVSAAEDDVSEYAAVAIGPAEEEGVYDLLLEPPDGNWLVDENGQEYVISRWPKFEGHYRWVDEEKLVVRLGPMPPMTAIDHDSEYLYFRFDKPGEFVAPVRERRPEWPYPAPLPETDRLRLAPFQQGLPETGQWRQGFAVADMNEDGRLDLVMPPPRKGSGLPVIFLGDGAGGWTAWPEVRFPDVPYDYGDVAVADLDGDGHQDMVLAMHLMGLLALRGDGAGGFTLWTEGLPMREDAFKRRPAAPSSVNSTVRRTGDPAAERESAGFSSRAIALADWNGDRRPDVIALSEGPTSLEGVLAGDVPETGKMIFLNQGDGTWTPVLGPGSQLGDHVLAVDLDGDGATDFVTSTGRVGDDELLNYHDGESWVTLGLPLRERQRTSAVAAGDFDGDGRVDLALAYQAPSGDESRYGIDLYLGRPAPADSAQPVEWERLALLAWPRTEGPGVDALAVGDLDGDGDDDLAALPVVGGAWLFTNEGEGRFAREVTPEADPGDRHHYCAGYRGRLVDLDGDGRVELAAVFAGEPGSEALLLGKLKTRCPARGAIRVWRIEHRESEESPAPAAAADLRLQHEEGLRGGPNPL